MDERLEALTPEERQDLQFAYNFGTLEPEPGTVEAAAFDEMNAYARSEVARVANAEAADEAWRQSPEGRAEIAQREAEAG